MEFVYSVNNGHVAWGPAGSTVHMAPNDIWFADDPFVLDRPDLFSATPTRVHSTQGRETPPATPVGQKPELVVARPRGRRA